MRPIWRLFLLILKVLNWWFFVISGSYSFIALVGYNLYIYLYFGRWSIEAVQESLGRDTFQFYLFQLFIAFPMFWSFICCWTDAKMTSSSFGKRVNSALNSAIDYRKGQMNIKTPQEAFEILKTTASLDLMKANEGQIIFDKAIQGFNSEFGNQPPQKVVDALTKKK